MKNKPVGFIEPVFNEVVTRGIEASLGAPAPDVAVCPVATANG